MARGISNLYWLRIEHDSGGVVEHHERCKVHEVLVRQATPVGTFVVIGGWHHAVWPSQLCFVVRERHGTCHEFILRLANRPAGVVLQQWQCALWLLAAALLLTVIPLTHDIPDEPASQAPNGGTSERKKKFFFLASPKISSRCYVAPSLLLRKGVGLFTSFTHSRDKFPGWWE